MSVDFSYCHECGETYCECGHYVSCECGEKWCSDDCATSNGYREGDFYVEDEKYTQGCSCSHCRGEVKEMVTIEREEYDRLLAFEKKHCNVWQ
jgi:hypothetical protein